MRVIAYLVAMALAAALFLLVPEIDIAASRLVFREADGFFLSRLAPVQLLYVVVDALPWMIAGAFIAWLAARAFVSEKRLGIRTSAVAYVVLSLAIGPGLVSNSILKENSGRARPAHIVEFGGERTFTPALVPADQCRRNCSFVSGHAAAGFFLVTFAFLVAPGRWRRWAFAGTLGLAAVIGASRILQGRHFLSDVVFAGFICVGIAWALYALIGARDSPGDRVIGRWEQRRAEAAPEGGLIASQAYAFFAVLALSILCYIGLDRPALKLFLTIDWDLHLVFKWIADWGRQVFWAVPSGLAFIGLALAARAPNLAARQAERLKAWSILPLFVFVALAVSGILGWLMKFSFGRMRPLHYYRHDDYGFSWFELDASLQSFPSGHAVTIATLATALSLIWPRYAAGFAILGATVIVARVLETAHFISDALFGAYLGIALAAWTYRVFERSGVDFAQVKAGRMPVLNKRPWAERLGLPAWMTGAVRPAQGEPRKAVSADPS